VSAETANDDPGGDAVGGPELFGLGHGRDHRERCGQEQALARADGGRDWPERSQRGDMPGGEDGENGDQRAPQEVGAEQHPPRPDLVREHATDRDQRRAGDAVAGQDRAEKRGRAVVGQD
jgi:hypothetical protein